MMVIEGADRFGLAQLHQLRGRVGRGTAESFCVLVSDSADETAQARLKAVAEIARRVRAGREGLRAPARGRRPGPRPDRVCRGCGSRRCRTAEHVALAEGRTRPRGGVAGRGRPVPWRTRRSGARAGQGLARAGLRGRRRRARREACARAVADAGRVIAGSARGIRLARRGEGTRPLTDRVKQTLFAILEPELRGRAMSSTCSPAAARPASRRCQRGAAHATFVEQRPDGRDDDRDEPRSDAPGRARDRATPGRRRPSSLTRPASRSTSSSSTRRTRTSGRSSTRSSAWARRGRRWPRAPGSSPSTSGGRAAGPGRAASIRARAPLRRDGADVLPARGRRSRGAVQRRGLPGLVRPDHERPPRRHPARRPDRRPPGRRRSREPAQGAAADRRGAASR